jgi:hypothetical protein
MYNPFVMRTILYISRWADRSSAGSFPYPLRYTEELDTISLNLLDVSHLKCWRLNGKSRLEGKRSWLWLRLLGMIFDERWRKYCYSNIVLAKLVWVRFSNFESSTLTPHIYTPKHQNIQKVLEPSSLTETMISKCHSRFSQHNIPTIRVKKLSTNPIIRTDPSTLFMNSIYTRDNIITTNPPLVVVPKVISKVNSYNVGDIRTSLQTSIIQIILGIFGRTKQVWFVGGFGLRTFCGPHPNLQREFG